MKENGMYSLGRRNSLEANGRCSLALLCLSWSETGLGMIYHWSIISIITLKPVLYTNMDVNHSNNSRMFDMEPQNKWIQFGSF